MIDETKVPRYAKHTDTLICGFFGPYRYLSNFYPASVWFEGEIYPSSEHAYQAAKFPITDRRTHNWQIMSPSETKVLGRTAPNNKEFEIRKKEVMLQIVLSKFLSNPQLKAALVSTGDKFLEESNAWSDVYWGVCDGKGENHLGKILMMVRDIAKKV